MKSPVLLLAVVWGLLVGTLVLSWVARRAYGVVSAVRAYRLRWLSWFFGGACAAPLVLAIGVLNARRRRRNGQSGTVLTADALTMQRTRSVWGTTLFYGGLMSAFMVCMTWETVHVPGFVVFVVAVCMAGGYLFALIMGQWKKSLLQAAEIERRKRAAQ